MNREAYVYIPNELRSKIPPLYTTENTADPTVWIKLFTPDSSWTWYITEASVVMKDGVHRPLGGSPQRVVFTGDSTEVQDVLCFGLVVGLDEELGYFSLSEMTAIRGPRGLRVERDLFFSPKRLSKVRTVKAQEGAEPKLTRRDIAHIRMMALAARAGIKIKRREE